MQISKGMRGLVLAFILVSIAADECSANLIKSINFEPAATAIYQSSYTIKNIFGDDASVLLSNPRSGSEANLKLTVIFGFSVPYITNNPPAYESVDEIIITNTDATINVPMDSTTEINMKVCGYTFLILHVNDTETSQIESRALPIKVQCPNSGEVDIELGREGSGTIQAVGGQDSISMDLKLQIKNIGSGLMASRSTLSAPTIEAFMIETSDDDNYSYDDLLNLSGFEAYKLNMFVKDLFEDKLGIAIESGDTIEATVTTAKVANFMCFNSNELILIIFFDPNNLSGDKNTSNNVIFAPLSLQCDSETLLQQRFGTGQGFVEETCSVTPSIDNPVDAIIQNIDYAFLYKSDTREFVEDTSNDMLVTYYRSEMLKNMANTLMDQGLCPPREIMESIEPELPRGLSSLMTNLSEELRIVKTQYPSKEDAIDGIIAITDILQGVSQAHLSTESEENEMFKKYTTKLLSLAMKLMISKMQMEYSSGDMHTRSSRGDRKEKTRSQMREMQTNIPINFPIVFPSLPSFNAERESASSGNRRRNKREASDDEKDYIKEWIDILSNAGYCITEIDAMMSFLKKSMEGFYKIASGEAPEDMNFIPDSIQEDIRAMGQRWEAIRDFNASDLAAEAAAAERLDVVSMIERTQDLHNGLLTGKNTVESFKEFYFGEYSQNLTEFYNDDSAALETLNAIFSVHEAIFKNAYDIFEFVSRNLYEFELLSYDLGTKPKPEEFCQLGAAMWTSTVFGGKKEEQNSFESPFEEEMDYYGMQKPSFYRNIEGYVHKTTRSSLIGSYFYKKIATCSCWSDDGGSDLGLRRTRARNNSGQRGGRNRGNRQDSRDQEADPEGVDGIIDYDEGVSRQNRNRGGRGRRNRQDSRNQQTDPEGVDGIIEYDEGVSGQNRNMQRRRRRRNNNRQGGRNGGNRQDSRDQEADPEGVDGIIEYDEGVSGQNRNRGGRGRRNRQDSRNQQTGPEGVDGIIEYDGVSGQNRNRGGRGRPNRQNSRNQETEYEESSNSIENGDLDYDFYEYDESTYDIYDDDDYDDYDEYYDDDVYDENYGEEQETSRDVGIGRVSHNQRGGRERGSGGNRRNSRNQAAVRKTRRTEQIRRRQGRNNSQRSTRNREIEPVGQTGISENGRSENNLNDTSISVENSSSELDSSEEK